MPFSAEHIAKFTRIQALRPAALRNFADGLGVWRGCRNAGCRRGRGCRDSHAFACLRAFMQALPEEDHRLLRYMVENRAKGLSPDEAAGQALMRIEAERVFGVI
jgi:hypothetical protein